jgi:hypothetical protein
MRSILSLTILALVLAGCGSGGGGSTLPRVDASAPLAGDDYRNGVAVSSSGTLAGEPDQTIQFNGSTVRFHVTSLGVDLAGYSGQEFGIGGNTYRLLIGKNASWALPNGVVELRSDAGSVKWDTNVPVGSG